ncbi:metallophosphoesterase [Massilia sp. W12]|uniref:metallophosphoesterase family protein n=1 Tax=Massilia sp. W12 TaxID=3126507 RepID=UPI0030D569E5
MGLSWLHISDLHFEGKHAWRDDGPRKKLLKYLRERFEEQPDLRPDLVFCTGDIAFGEKGDEPLAQQYQSAQKFFEALLTVCGEGQPLARERLFVTPGNHDVNRYETDEDAQEALIAKAKNSHEHFKNMNNRIAQRSKEFCNAMARLQAYSMFVKTWLPHQHDAEGRCHYAQVLQINGLQVGIAGLNSAWTCAGPHDHGHIWLGGQWQFENAQTALEDADIKIGMMHHPADWLCAAEHSYAKTQIQTQYDFWLSGHVHHAWVEDGIEHVKVAAGAVGAETFDEFGLNLVRIGDDGQAKVYLHAFRDDWIIKPIAGKAPKGVWDISACLKAGLKNKLRELAQTDKPVQPGAKLGGSSSIVSVNLNGAGQPEPASPDMSSVPPLLDDATRIAATIAALRPLIGRAQLSEFSTIAFGLSDAEQDDADALPREVHSALVADDTRIARAESSLESLLELCQAITTFRQPDGLTLSTQRKADIRANLIDAAQQLILLSAVRRPNPQTEDPQNAWPLLLELSISILVRPRISTHIDADIQDGKPIEYRDCNLMPLSGPELGEMSDDPAEGIMGQLYRRLYKVLFPTAERLAKVDAAIIGRIHGWLKQRKKNQKQVILSLRLNQHNPLLTADVLHSLRNIHVDVIQLTDPSAENLIFEWDEGMWAATLDEIFNVLQVFAPPK